MDETLLQAVARLDGLLTGLPGDALRNARQRSYLFASAVDFVLEASSMPYHLADGGYSRLLISDEGAILGLDAISRQDVKARWAEYDVQAAVADLERHLAASLAATPGGSP